MSGYKKPLPEVTPWSQPFWSAAKEHRLVFQHCPSCELNILYPKLFCPNCYSSDLQWMDASGRGEVYTFSVIHLHPPSPFRDSLPYVVAIVQLDEGVQLMTNIVRCAPEDVKCGMSVVAEFDDVTDDFTLVNFRPAAM
ncbi:MAG: Zn-ribbon domain-containing OB-fold protein [Chloroflexi bacterium]|nr:Zn-ribbon domain-containing OB-fold protein [Chloroflexota bacterium]